MYIPTHIRSRAFLYSLCVGRKCRTMLSNTCGVV